MKTKIIALIPARGGSKSVPRKNIIPILGKPLIVWSIEQALMCEQIDQCIVSTDDQEIAKIALDSGAQVDGLRPAHLATDESTDFDVFNYEVNKHNKLSNDSLIVHLRPTSPVRTQKILNATINAINRDQTIDSARSVSLAQQSPYKMWHINNNFLTPLITLEGIKDAHSTPRQKLPKVYWQNGNIDVIRVRTILEKKSMVGEKIYPILIPYEAPDLDYKEDISKLELALEKINLCLDQTGGRLEKEEYFPT